MPFSCRSYRLCHGHLTGSTHQYVCTYIYIYGCMYACMAVFNSFLQADELESILQVLYKASNFFLPVEPQGLPTPLALWPMWVRGLRPDELWMVFTSFLHSRIRSSVLRTLHHLYPLLRHLVDHADGVPICWQCVGHGEGQCLNQNVRCEFLIVFA